MPKQLTDAQISQYHDDGFCFPVNVMLPQEAAQIRADLEDAERQHPEALNPSNRNNLHLVFSWLDQVVHHPVLLDAVEDLLGENFLAYGSVLFLKEPHTDAFVSWHQDLTYMPLEPHDGVTAWLALSRADELSGCMRMIPGSHKLGIQTHHDQFGSDNILTRGQTIEGMDENEAVDLLLEPGQISLHHGRTIHCSAANRSNDRRIGIAIQQYIPIHCREAKGGGYAQLARGVDTTQNFELLPRVKHDLSTQARAVRERVNTHWAEFLYDGAEQKRAY